MQQPSHFEPDTRSGATFSPCRRYRYRLERVWDDGLPLVNFLMLNPSTADETNPDPTITRCVDFARSWDCGGIIVTNLFAWRSTDPKGLWGADDPVGPENDGAIERAAIEARIVVAAWGAHKTRGRVIEVRVILARNDIPLYHIGMCKGGEPRHPLMVVKTAIPQRWEG